MTQFSDATQMLATRPGLGHLSSTQWVTKHCERRMLLTLQPSNSNLPLAACENSKLELFYCHLHVSGTAFPLAPPLCIKYSYSLGVADLILTFRNVSSSLHNISSPKTVVYPPELYSYNSIIGITWHSHNSVIGHLFCGGVPQLSNYPKFIACQCAT